jgi:hemerythrin-like domain-containing protein
MDSDVDPLDLLLEQHDTLVDLFASHQEALLDRRWTEAAGLLEEYDRRLRRHMRVEEEHLLSRCEHAQAVRWPAKVYRAEHRRIEQLMERAAEHLTNAQRREITPAVLLSLLDEERTLKHLVEHHHEREEKGLFGELRRELSGVARSALAAELIASERH